MTKKSILATLAAAGIAMTAAQTASAAYDPNYPWITNYECEVTICGATLFKNFFGSAASTNDYIDVDGDMQAGIYGSLLPDQLCTTWTGTTAVNYSTYWMVHYRGTGSIEGINELMLWHCCGDLDYAAPKPGYWGRYTYANPSILWGGPADSPSLSPKNPYDVDYAVSDVPATWGLQVPGGTPEIDLKPGDLGYGACPILSWDTGYESKYPSLAYDCNNDGTPDCNFDLAAGTAMSLYDTPVAWAPTALCANRGTGLSQIKATEAQYLWSTGRMPNGENLLVATRAWVSGTRNMTMNCLGIDPSWGRGDNLGSLATGTPMNLGPDTQVSNCKGSGDMRNTLTNHRLAVGYNGINGYAEPNSSAAEYRYEIIDVMFDDRGGTQYVRPGLDNILDNCDPNTGWQIGGPESFITLGDPDETDPASPTYIRDNCATQYILNIKKSIEDFVTVPGSPESYLMPGEYLAQNFFLIQGIDCQPLGLNPTNFQPTPGFNQALQTYMRNNNVLNVEPYGTNSPAGRVPTRNADASGYTDGTSGTSGVENTYYYTGGTVSGGSAKLSASNEIAGDFDLDGARTLADADEMVSAMLDPRNFDTTDNGGNKGGMVNDVIIPEVIGDFDGDGNFDKEDLRYWADGLAMNTGNLDRKSGAIAIDAAIVADANGGAAMLPWAMDKASGYRLPAPAATAGGNPVLTAPATSVNAMKSTGAAYKNGDFRGDVAGDTPYPGAKPNGWDGLINCNDVQYVIDNMNAGSWSNLVDATWIDLSCDMDGDVDVDWDDVVEIVTAILDTTMDDVNLDGTSDATDRGIIVTNDGMTDATWCDGDIDGDGDVDADDLALWDSMQASAPAIVSAESVRTHGTAGEFGIAILGSDDTECRLGGPSKIVIVFDQNVQAADGTLDTEVVLSSGTIAGMSIAGATLTVNTTVGSFCDDCCLTITVSGISAQGAPAVVMTPATMGIRLVACDNTAGPTYGAVNVLDVIRVKQASGQPVTGANFRYDADASGGVLNVLDVIRAKQESGGTYTATCP